MKIVQMGTKYFPAHGGVEVTLRQECEWLKGQGHEVEVLCSDLAEHLRGVKLKKGSPTVNGIPVKRCWSFTPPRITYPVMPSLPVRLWWSRADVVHAHAFWYFPADAAARVCKKRKIPFVFNPHFSPRRSTFWNRYQRTVGAQTIQAADVVVAVSEWEKRLILQEGFKPKRLEVISSGVDPEEFKAIRHNVFERYGIASRPIVLFVGRIAPDKGLDLLFRAAVGVLGDQPDVVFFVAGYDFGYWREMEHLAKRLGIRDHVI